MNLQALVEEFNRAHLGPLWLQAVRDVCRSVVTSYSPEVYAHGISWNDELEDLVQEVVTDRLLKEGQVRYLIDIATTGDDVRRLLARQIRITLAHRRRRTVVDQLLDRSRPLLANAPFALVAQNPSAWTLGGKSVEDRTPSPSEMRRAQQRVRSIPVTSGRGTERAPMIYRTDDLRTALLSIAEVLPTAFRLADLDRIFSSVLTPFTPGFLDSVDTASAVSTADPTQQEHDVDMAVAQMVEALDPEQRVVVAAKLSGTADADIAVALGVSRPTAAKRRDAAFMALRPALENLNEPSQEMAASRLASALVSYWPPTEAPA